MAPLLLGAPEHCPGGSAALIYERATSEADRRIAVTMALTWRNFDSRVTATRTSALIWHTGGRSDLQRTGVNAILTPD